MIDDWETETEIDTPEETAPRVSACIAWLSCSYCTSLLKYS